jgi:hypothetical protein
MVCLVDITDTAQPALHHPHLCHIIHVWPYVHRRHLLLIFIGVAHDLGSKGGSATAALAAPAVQQSAVTNQLE